MRCRRLHNLVQRSFACISFVYCITEIIKIVMYNSLYIVKYVIALRLMQHVAPISTFIILIHLCSMCIIHILMLFFFPIIDTCPIFEHLYQLQPKLLVVVFWSHITVHPNVTMVVLRVFLCLLIFLDL